MSNVAKVRFDSQAFAQALEAARWDKRVEWSQVDAETGISKPTLCRIRQGKRPDADSLARLIRWSGIDFRQLIVEESTGRTIRCSERAWTPLRR